MNTNEMIDLLKTDEISEFTQELNNKITKRAAEYVADYRAVAFSDNTEE